MIRATHVQAAGSWTDSAADTVVLDFEDRHRRRTVMNGVRGLAFLLDLPEAVALRGGDALRLEDGRLVEVVSAPEPLLEIRGARTGDLVRLAWHLGNRHLPAQLLANAIRIRRDHVIEDMLRRLGAKLVEIDGPFDPEGGAYASGGHGSRDAHDPDHRHDSHTHDHHDHGHHKDHAHGHHDHEHHGHEHHGHEHKHHGPKHHP